MAVWDSEGFNRYMAVTDPGGAYLKTLMPKPEYITSPNKDTSVPVIDPNSQVSGLATATPAAPASSGFNWTDRGFLNLVAGIGAGLDPEGAGGAIGKATIAYNQSKQSEKALTDKEKARQDHTNKIVNMLGGMGHSGMAGPRSVKNNDDGSITIQYDPPPELKNTPPTNTNQVSGASQNSTPTQNETTSTPLPGYSTSSNLQNSLPTDSKFSASRMSELFPFY